MLTIPFVSTLALAAGAVQGAFLPGHSGGGHHDQLLNRRAVPSGWSLVVTNGNDGGGCYADGGGDNRVLKDYAGRVGGSSIDKMIAECSKRGFAYAGLEYGGEIYCASSLPSNLQPAPSAQCNVKCSSGETCGGAYRMNLYTNAKAEAAASVWSSIGCMSDSSSARTLAAYSFSSSQMTNAMCQQRCSDQGYKYAGTQYYTQCYCDNKYVAGRKIADTSCNTPCPGGGGTCGGAWALSMYENTVSTSAAIAPIAAPPTSSTRTTAASTPTATTTTRAATTTTSSTTSSSTTAPAATGITVPSSYIPASNFPASSGEKQVYAHHMVGNTYPYTPSDWQADIAAAQAAGIDGFFLNIGYDEWQPKQVGYAYAAAQSAGFKSAISFDMTVFGCGDASRVPLFRQYLTNYLSHPAAAKYKGKSIVTTFAGEGCTFGAGSVNAGWASVFSGVRDKVYFAPAFNTDPQRLPSFDIDAEVNWGSAWPDRGKEIETSRDEWFMKQLGSKGYIGTVSPLFATHLSYKNWIWRGDNMLHAARWEQLLGMRDRIDQVQVLAWNDFGESIYLNDLRGDMPPEAKLYANKDFPHTDLLSLQAFYSFAWKAGRYPAITKDQIWMMARPHPAGINIGGAPLPAPDNRDLTNDNFYAQIHLLADANLVLCSGAAASTCKTQAGKAGINRVSGPLVAGQTPSIRVERNGKASVAVTAPMAFNGSPVRYNYNYWVKSS